MEKDTLILFLKEILKKENSWHFISSKLTVYEEALKVHQIFIKWGSLFIHHCFNHNPEMKKLLQLPAWTLTLLSRGWQKCYWWGRGSLRLRHSEYQQVRNSLHPYARTMNWKAISEFICMHCKCKTCLEDIIQDLLCFHRSDDLSWLQLPWKCFGNTFLHDCIDCSLSIYLFIWLSCL